MDSANLVNVLESGFIVLSLSVLFIILLILTIIFGMIYIFNKAGRKWSLWVSIITGAIDVIVLLGVILFIFYNIKFSMESQVSEQL